MNNLNWAFTNTGTYPLKYVKRLPRLKEEDTSTDISVLCNVDPSNLLKSNSLDNLNKGFATKGVSAATKKKIAVACRVLSYASEKVKIRTPAGIYTEHLTLFITLTLPSAQFHEDTFITKNLLGSFLDRCRKLGLLSNYVWKAEKQRNGNIHYHILTDTYASFSFIRNIWYLSLKKYGYMRAYSDKFINMSFDDYRNLDFNKKKPLNDITRAFARGKRNKFSEPPAVDVKQVNDNKAVSAYISKYISKSSDNADNFVNGRSWGCSSSVSDAVKLFKNDAEFNRYWYECSEQVLRKEVFVSDWFSVVKCSFTSFITWFPDVKKYIKKIFKKVFVPCEFYKYSLGLIHN